MEYNTCFLSYTASAMPVDVLATLGVRASAGMVFTPQNQNILCPASEELIGETDLLRSFVSLWTKKNAKYSFLEICLFLWTNCCWCIASCAIDVLLLSLWMSIVMKYCQTSNIGHALVGNKIVDHLDVAGASPIGAAPTTSSFSTQHLAPMDWTKSTAGRDEKHLSFGIWCALY